MKTLRALAWTAALSTTFAAATARAGIIDLTTANASGTAGGAIFQQGEFQPTGSGVFNAFLRVEEVGPAPSLDGIEQGYNTDYRPVQFDEKTDAPHTHSILLGDVPIVTIGGTQYRQFLLDLNEPQGGKQNPISMDMFEIFLGDAADLSDYPSFNGHAYKIYDMDLPADTSILLDAATNKGGSGKGDMYAFVPNALFTGVNQYVYLHSLFGSTPEYATQGGFEEWGIIKSDPVSIPTPGAAGAGLSTLAMIAGVSVLRRTRRRAVSLTA